MCCHPHPFAQFGYVTLFVVACPLAPLLAFISDYVESRVDALKLCEGARRPMPDGARDIGTWEDILKFMGKLYISSDAYIIPHPVVWECYNIAHACFGR